MLKYSRVDGDEFLQTTRLPKALHWPFSSSEWQLPISNPVVEPATHHAPFEIS